MESMSLEQREVILDTLQQIREAIKNLLSWNKHVNDMNELLKSPNGMQALAGNCMLIMTIAFTACTKSTRIVDYPLVEGANTGNLAVERVEASDTATILHCRGFNRPHFWFWRC